MITTRTPDAVARRSQYATALPPPRLAPHVFHVDKCSGMNSNRVITWDPERANANLAVGLSLNSDKTGVFLPPGYYRVRIALGSPDSVAYYPYLNGVQISAILNPALTDNTLPSSYPWGTVDITLRSVGQTLTCASPTTETLDTSAGACSLSIIQLID